jgi:CPA1 family monovalent cation:H+ antiporter
VDLFRIIAVLITLTALFSYLNHRYVHMPMTIGIMLIAFVVSSALLVLHRFGFVLDQEARAMLATIDFNRALFRGMLGFLLFAGALHVDLEALAHAKWVVALLSTTAVVTSTIVTGGLIWVVLSVVGLRIPLVYCFLFGALISPTDPIAVLGILKSVGVPKSLETAITGESLFNDGVGVVVFTLILEIATGSAAPSTAAVAVLFAREAVGGAAFGLAGGLAAFFLLRSVDDYQVEVLLTLALVMGTYALADALHLSAPIAVVVAGLLTGNQGRSLAMSDVTREHVDTFWELVDEILNAVLFVLIGLEILALPFTREHLLAGLIAIPLVLLARLVSVAVAVRRTSLYREFGPHVVRVLTWAGLRGGISVALALGLPRGPEREVIVAITYAVVMFSIVVQGLSIGWVIERSGLRAPEMRRP